MKPPFDLHVGLCLLGALSTISSQLASGQHNELFHVPHLQHGSLAVPRQDRISSSLCQMIKVSSSFADVEHVMVNISRMQICI